MLNDGRELAGAIERNRAGLVGPDVGQLGCAVPCLGRRFVDSVLLITQAEKPFGCDLVHFHSGRGIPMLPYVSSRTESFPGQFEEVTGNQNFLALRQSLYRGEGAWQ